MEYNERKIMEALAIVLLVGVVLGILAFLSFFVFVFISVFKGLRRVAKAQKEWDRKW